MTPGRRARGGPGRRRLVTRDRPPYPETVIVEVSEEAAAFIAKRGGRLWVWAAPPRMCCAGSPPWMHAATEPPPGLSGFCPVGEASQAGVQVQFRGPGDLRPGTLEIGLHGTRRPRLEAYWDGCLMAMP